MAVKATTKAPAAAKKPPAKATAKGVPGKTAARPAATSAGAKGTARGRFGIRVESGHKGPAGQKGLYWSST